MQTRIDTEANCFHMELYLSKILPIFVYPVGLTLCLALFAGLCSLWRWRRLARFSLFLAVAILWIAATPAVGEFLYRQLERQYPPLAIADTPAADAAILLGGVLRPPLLLRQTADLNDAIDRVVQAARLYRAGKVQWILIAAGNLPWSRASRSEAEWIADLLIEWGIPRTALLLDTASRNTAENAAYARALMLQHGLRTGLLVTSAGHMPRALALFQGVGIDVTPCATDLRAAGDQQGTVFYWLPDVTALELTTLAIREWLGIMVNRFRGRDETSL